jgi:hypothetical protein
MNAAQVQDREKFNASHMKDTCSLVLQDNDDHQSPNHAWLAWNRQSSLQMAIPIQIY